MKEISDRQFDELLKQKAESFDYDFDESAWDKMEQKLRRRDRIIFIRNSSFLLLFLMLSGAAFLLTNRDIPDNNSGKQVKEQKDIGPKFNADEINPSKDEVPVMSQNATDAPIKKAIINPINEFKASAKSKTINTKPSKNTEPGEKHALIINPEIKKPDSSLTLSSIHPQVSTTSDPSLTEQQKNLDPPSDNPVDSSAAAEKNKPEKRRKLALSLTLLAGPESSSINSLAGDKGTLNTGIMLNFGLSNKVTLSTGAKYGIKYYAANGYNYAMQNPSRADKLEGIDASCNILEIPLQASYAILKTSDKQFKIASGLSSYLMLKEEYNFRYKPYAGYKDYLLVKKNANQHYLSVLSFSAIYQIKPKSSQLLWGIEPYVKLPLGGVGEGNVRLKSSGISLNLTYDLSKKIK
ncbi:MAG: hypothetical protein H7Y13_12525 [Sphingobacteriaceae bacterium]|nr:hypothetical protein [Sphingobacteriaceae bacterium]